MSKQPAEQHKSAGYGKVMREQQASQHNLRGFDLWCEGEYEAALYEYQQAINLVPELALSYSNCGYVYTDMSRYADAIASFDRAIELDPADYSLYDARATVYHKIGQTSKR